MAFLWAAVLLLGIISSTEGSVSYWGPWSPWSTCSMTCGRGTQTRTRVCLKYQTCEGPATETRYCDYPPCQPKCIPPPPSKWGPWSRWSPCSVSCGGGSRTRKRLCLKYDCIGPNTETGPCNYQKCPPTMCPDDERSQEQEWELTTVEIFTNSTDIMIGTVDCKGQKLGLCWRFEDMTFDQSVTIVSPPCNRLRAGTAESGSPVGQYLGDDCTYEVPVGDDVQVNVMDALGGVCDITQYPVAPDCPNSQVVEIDFFSQKTDIGVLLNVIPEDDEISVLVGLLGNDTTLAGTGFMRYNATIKAIPGTPWKGVRYIDNDRRVLINGQCTYFTTSQRKQTVFVGPVCGGFGDWGPWEDCMLTVKGWRQLRRRPCDNPPPQNDGECEGNQFQYRRCVCAAPVIPPTAFTGPLQTGYNHSDTVEVCCRKGYVSALTGRSSFTICCDFFNRWENFQTCIRQECPYPVFRNGVVKKGKPPYYPGAEVTVVCNHGYTNIYGKRTFKSRCTGTEWFPGRCVRKYCNPLPSITYSLSVTTGVSSYRPGDTVRVTCVVGYTLSPNKTLTCDDNGHWTPSLRCLATTCPNAIDLFRYNIGSARLGEPGTPEYNVAFLTCKFGFTARGQPSYTSTCLPDGTWSNLQQCQQSGGGMKLVMDKTSIGLLVGLLLVVGLSALFCFLLCCKNICCAPKQPVLIPPARPPVHCPPIYQAPPACPPPPCPKPKQPSSFWRVMYRLRQTPAPTVVSTC